MDFGSSWALFKNTDESGDSEISYEKENHASISNIRKFMENNYKENEEEEK
jgi:hypothetical protein